MMPSQSLPSKGLAPALVLGFHVLYSESVEAKTTLVLRDSKSAARSLKAMISVGHTKVQAMGTKPRTTHWLFDVYWLRLKSVHWGQREFLKDHFYPATAESTV